jgi:L-lactate dehydrogenase complex protein LldG
MGAVGSWVSASLDFYARRTAGAPYRPNSDYDGRVYRATVASVQDVIRELLTHRSNPRMLVSEEFSEEWILEDLSITADVRFDYTGLDKFDGVMAGATVAIAETGTIVLQHQRDQGRRTMTLIPDYHLCR